MAKFKKLLRMIQNVISIVFILLLLSLIKVHYEFEQNKSEVFVRDDTFPQTLEETLCLKKKNPNNVSLLAATAWMSEDIYPKKEVPEDIEIQNIRESWEKKFRSNWTQVEEQGRDKYGFPFEIWENSKEKILVIVFKGTTFTSPDDWQANFHWFKDLIGQPDQYSFLRSNLGNVLSKYKGKDFEEYRFVSTGHSLGGGLAQHAVYSNEKIEEAYVFNSSMVTGWSDFKIDKLQGNDGTALNTRIYRTHENGEVLEFFRLLMKVSYQFNAKPNRHPYVTEYRMNFDEEKLKIISQHGIGLLVTKLTSSDLDCMNREDLKMEPND